MYKESGEGKIDLDRKIFGVVTFGLICALLLILLVNVSINTSSGIRAYVAGEGYWAKAQKESIIHLSHYVITEDPEDLRSFRSVLRVNKGDRAAREQLQQEDFNYDEAYDGFLRGLNHPDDIPEMITLFRRFENVPHVRDAIEAWEAGDAKIEELIQFADSVDHQIRNADISLTKRKEWLERLNDLDHQLTEYELRFSNAMGTMARLVNDILRWSTIILGITLICIGIWLTLRFYKSAKMWVASLRDSEEKFKHVLKNSKDVLYKMDLKTRKYVFVSPAIKGMLGYDPKDFLEGGVEFILDKMHPEDKDRMDKVVERYNQLDSGDFMPVVEFRLKDSEGNWKWVSNVRTLVRDDEGNPEAIIGAVRDISTQKEQEEKIKESLQEKEMLLKEIHHRVKNNLSIISSLLELQKDGVDQEVQDMLSSSQARIKSIAKVHQKLYESTTLSDIPLDTYITELTEEIQKAYASEKKDIDIQIDVESVSVNINDAIPIGLILNELINNAFKHAYKGLDSGLLNISLHKKEEGLQLCVKNDGHEMDENFDPSASDSLGMTLIQVLLKRINGSLEIENGDLTNFKIDFSLEQ